MLREPLLHFVLIGAALFVLYQWQRPASGLTDNNRIVVTSTAVERLTAGFERTWQRPPTRQEESGLIDNFVREEIYYREAKAMGLDRDDIVVRRRLRQKLEFIMEDVADQVEPSDDQLRAFMAQSPQKYMYEPRFSFRQVYFNPAQHGEHLERDLGRELARLGTHTAGSVPAKLGGDSSLLPQTVSNWTRSAVVASFGEAFVGQLEMMQRGAWHGPVASEFGSHIVLLQDQQQGHLPPLAPIRESVRRDWLLHQQKILADQAYRELRKRYLVTIEAAEPDRLALAGNEAER